MATKALYGESPAMIARRMGTSVSALISANPQKPTTVVAGRYTFQGLRQGEVLNTPPGVGIGTPSDLNAPHAMIRQGSSGPDVELWQTIIGVTADGKFGPQTAAATRTWQGAHGLSADGVVGPLTWAAAGAGGTPAPSAPSLPSIPSAGLTVAAGAAVAALLADPNYCSSVGRTGTPVNTAVHNFKAAWNSSNPGSPVPIGTGKYEPSVAAALSSALGGVPTPPGCGGAAPSPSPVQPPPVNPSPSPSPAPANIPSAVQALSSFDPCNAANTALVCQLQNALGIAADGKYGPGTAAAAQRLLPGAPAGCSPRPSWWRPTGQSNCGGAAPPPPPPAPGGSPPPAPGTTPGGGGQIQPPAATKGLSTGALVAGAIGAAALVGIVALGVSGGKKGARGARGRKGAKRKPAHHKKKHKAKKHKKH